MQFKVININHFFQKQNLYHLSTFSQSQIIMQAFFSETPIGQFSKKILLTDTYFIISQKINEQYTPTHYLELNQHIKFQNLYILRDSNSKTPISYGFTLINNKQQAIKIYFQYSTILELWISRLSSLLNQIGFNSQYKIICKIGQGSTSSVYKIQRILDDRIFSAKVFLKSYLQSKSERKTSFFNEISLLRSLDHNNILKIYSVFQTNTAYYIITQFLQGGSLLQKCNTPNILKLQEIKEIMYGIISGLNYIHKYGLMHRDIKLQNIMFRSKDSLDVVIVDFGLATISEDEPYIFYRCGTPGYIAPQIIRMVENQKIDPSCDIFSAGVLMHILLTNQPLFSGETNQQVYKNNKQLKIDLFTQKYKQLDEQAMDLLRQMLEIDPLDRIATQDIFDHKFFSELSDILNSDKYIKSPTATSQYQTYQI